MLRQILSVGDLKRLKKGDRISDHPDLSIGKIYIIGNVLHGLVYAIHDNGSTELKVFQTDEMPAMDWWVYPPELIMGEI